jgi:hypothetical protein
MQGWLSWSDAPKMLLSSLPGWIALWRTLRSERTILKFRFEAALFEGRDEFGEYYSAPAIRFTVTNNGKRPVSLDSFICDATFKGSRNNALQPFSTSFAAVTLGHGEPHSAWVELSANPAAFGGAYAKDSTGKIWPAAKPEISQLCDAARKRWPTSMG